MKYIKRLLTLPFMLCVVIVGYLFVLFKFSYYFMRYGGEVITYMRDDEPTLIRDIYEELVDRKESDG